MIGDVLSYCDSSLALLLGELLRLIFWAGLAGAGSIGLYALLSPQHKLQEIDRKIAEVKKLLAQHQDEFDTARRLIGQQLSLALRRVGLVLGPSLLVGLPVIALLAWMDSTYGHQLPEVGATVAIEITPGDEHVYWKPTDAASWQDSTNRWQVDWPAKDAPIILTDTDGNTLLSLPLKSPSPVVTHYNWWHWLFGNPSGYIQAESPVERVSVQLPHRKVLPWGPAWLQSWLTFVLIVVCASALVTKVIFKIK